MDKIMKNKFNIVPIKRVDVYQTVISRIRSMINDHKLSHGERLPSERDMAELLNVSRSSIRQALKAMEAMGEVEIRIGSGTYVSEQRNHVEPVDFLLNGREVDLQFLQNLAEARAAIECKIVELAAEKGKNGDWDAIRKLLESQGEQEDDEEIGSLDLRFEKQLANVANNPVLALLQRWVHHGWLTAWGRLGIAPDDKRSLSDEHFDILRAIEEGDIEKAIHSMKNHVDRTI